MPRDALSSPRPVEAFPCGSRSTSRTLCSAASAVARLMAVVVFPTPPFWLARAMTRGAARSGLGAGRADLSEAEDGGGRLGPAGKSLDRHCPVAEGGGQFVLCRPAFRKQGYAVWREYAVGVAQQHGQRRKRTGRDDG